MRVRTKICGITRVDDALAAVEAGADALGFNFHPGSPRYIAPERAGAIVARLPPFVATVGLFVNARREHVTASIEAAGVACLQFHGDETAEWCESFDRPYIKAVRVAGAVDAAALVSAYPRVGAFLLDAHVPGLRGGTGKSFDWAHWPRTCARPLMLAGGLDADNVASAIADTRPFAVDVCSGVESEQPGVKCPKKMERFVNEVLRASQRL